MSYIYILHNTPEKYGILHSWYFHVQWRIYIQKFLARAPPTGPNSFVFTYVFTEKHMCWRLVPPPMRVDAPPMGNPGSAPDVYVVHWLNKPRSAFVRLIKIGSCEERQLFEKKNKRKDWTRCIDWGIKNEYLIRSVFLKVALLVRWCKENRFKKPNDFLKQNFIRNMKPLLFTWRTVITGFIITCLYGKNILDVEPPYKSNVKTYKFTTPGTLQGKIKNVSTWPYFSW